ncbi:unnamed protein product [Jaminaea pallidilutea]
MSSNNMQTQQHMLRVLVVDDNALNLSVLCRLLSKRFSHLIDGSPVAVDSGLKALQLLRENVYDVILMDIQMPFLSGVDCTERIRKGEDGVLAANRDARIVAVTTAVGDEPEILYRRKGFDGLIGKPVAYDVMRELLMPLSSAASLAAGSIPLVSVADQMVLPPLPPLAPNAVERLFFLPSNGQASAPGMTSAAPEITKSSHFESLLKAQTRESLHFFGAGAMALTEDSFDDGVSDRRRLRKYDDDSDEDEGMSASTHSDPQSPPSTKCHISMSPTRSAPTHSQQVFSPTRQKSTRKDSLTISQSTLHAQLQKEMEAACVQLPHRAASVRRATSSPRQRTSMPPIRLQSTVFTDEEPACSESLLGGDSPDRRSSGPPLSPYEAWLRQSDGQSEHVGFSLASMDERRRRVSADAHLRSTPSSSSDDDSPTEDSTPSDSAGLTSHRSNSLTTECSSCDEVTTPDSETFSPLTEGLKISPKSQVSDPVFAPLGRTKRPLLERHNASVDVRSRTDSRTSSQMLEALSLG